MSSGAENPGAETDLADDGPCAVVNSLEQIGSQWRLIVLHDLQDGEKRFNELKRSTDASSRTLSRVLDDLQEMGFVDRRMEEDAPVATYYSLTPKGTSLCPVFDEIERWADEWLHAASDGESEGADEGEAGGATEAKAESADERARATGSDADAETEGVASDPESAD